MKEIYISTACLKGKKNYRRVIETFLQNGIKNIELTGVHPYKKMKSLEKTIKHYKKKGANFTFHNYFPPPKKPIVLNYLSGKKSERDKAKKIIKSSVQLAKKTGVKIYAFHPGYLREATVNSKGYFNFYGKKRKKIKSSINTYNNDFYKFYKSLKLDKKKQNVFLGLENLFPNNDGTNDSFMCTFKEVEKLFSYKFKSTNLCLLIDLGHLAIASKILKFDRYKYLENITKKFGDRIMEVHISNNDEKNDLHDRITKNSWQLKALKYFKDTGKLVGGTIFTLESRRLKINEIKEDIKLLRKFIK